MEVEERDKETFQKAIENSNSMIDEKALRSCHENLIKMKKVIDAAEPRNKTKQPELSTSEKLKTIESRNAFLY